jgi:hypothetical protein
MTKSVETKTTSSATEKASAKKRGKDKREVDGDNNKAKRVKSDTINLRSSEKKAKKLKKKKKNSSDGKEKHNAEAEIAHFHNMIAAREAELLKAKELTSVDGCIEAAEKTVSERTVMQDTFKRKEDMDMLTNIAAYVGLVEKSREEWESDAADADIVNCESPIWDDGKKELKLLHDIQTTLFWMIDVMEVSGLEIGLTGCAEGLTKAVAVYMGK